MDFYNFEANIFVVEANTPPLTTLGLHESLKIRIKLKHRIRHLLLR
jgi:hypothetical protein